MTMKIEVWVTAEDTDYGTIANAFATEEAATAYLWGKAEGEGADTIEDLKERYDGDVYEALHGETDAMDTFNMDGQIIDIPLSQIFAVTLASLKKRIKRFF